MYVFGAAGCGKTCSVLTGINTPFYSVQPTSNFPMTSFAGEPDILIDDFEPEKHYDKMRTLLLQLTGGYTACIEKKGSDITQVELKGKC